MYATLAQVEARVPRALIVQALDDNRDGEIDADVQAALEAAVDREIDGLVGQRYQTPFTGAIPAAIESAAVILRCEALYQRRGVPPDQNPFAAAAAAIRKKLDRIGRGDDPLSPDTPKARPSASIVSEPSVLTPATDPATGEATTPPRHLN